MSEQTSGEIEIASMKVQVRDLMAQIGGLGISISEHVSSIEASEGDHTNALALYRTAEEQVCIAAEMLSAAIAYVEWARDQQTKPNDKLTALLGDDHSGREIKASTSFDDGPPMWRVDGDRLANTNQDHWHLFINEDLKARSTLEVIVYAAWGKDGLWDRRPIPVFDMIEVPTDAPELTWTIQQWVDLAKAKAEAYIAAHDVIEAAGKVYKRPNAIGD
ncbi:hypothetical protein [Ensifer aridi]|uniref:hypothetical protein n=1 Tax=Ensifer aridi TaxID=1708715 RepID=UPI00111C9395|nr:hypothetical protein [Ensifer aridi]